MAGEIIAQNMTEGLSSAVAGAFSNIPGMNAILQIGKAIGIVVLVYLAILIIKTIVQTRQALRIKSLAKNVEEINKKMDLLVGKKKK